MDKIFLGRRIREQRQLKGFSQDDLAKKIGVGSLHLGHIERGNKTPSMETFVKIVNVLNVPADILLRDAVDSGKLFILNEVTHEMKNLAPAHLRIITELVKGVIDSLNNLDKVK